MAKSTTGLSRRELLTLAGYAAGASAMYGAMLRMGHAAPSTYDGPPKLDGDPGETSVLILGSGLAGMTAAYELGRAGYKVQILDYRDRAGGRCWTTHPGETYTELGGATQTADFAEGNYFNHGPWRIPADHHGVLAYCKKFGVKLEPFIQRNYYAYLHNTGALEGKPQRYREVAADFRGQIAELLAKAIDQGKLDEEATDADGAALVEALKTYGMLDDNLEYVSSAQTSAYRGWKVPPGGGADPWPVPSEIITLKDIVDGRLWEFLIDGDLIDYQPSIFQPVGGMEEIAKGFARHINEEVGDVFTFNAKVVRITGGDDGVEVAWVPAQTGGKETIARADYCICTIPFSVLGQVENNFSSGMKQAIDGVYYEASIKVGLEFKRRFWEQDERIFGGITYTDMPISLISYPSNDYFSDGPGILLGAYSWGAAAYNFTSIDPAERIERALEFGEKIHPQYRDEFKTGFSVGWHRVPWVLGCYGEWRDKEAHYPDAVAMDQRVLMAGEHMSELPAWQEGAVLSGLDAVKRLHAHVTKG